MLAELQRLESAVKEASRLVKLAWARTARAALTSEQQRQFEAAAVEFANAVAAVGRAHIDVPKATPAESDPEIEKLQALFAHIPPYVSLSEELIQERRREAWREAREIEAAANAPKADE
jgi:hypothetical protein